MASRKESASPGRGRNDCNDCEEISTNMEERLSSIESWARAIISHTVGQDTDTVLRSGAARAIQLTAQEGLDNYSGELCPNCRGAKPERS